MSNSQVIFPFCMQYSFTEFHTHVDDIAFTQYERHRNLNERMLLLQIA